MGQSPYTPKGHTSKVITYCCFLFSCHENNSQLLGFVKPWATHIHKKGVVFQSNEDYLGLSESGLLCPSNTSRQCVCVSPSVSVRKQVPSVSPVLWSLPGWGRRLWMGQLHKSCAAVEGCQSRLPFTNSLSAPFVSPSIKTSVLSQFPNKLSWCIVLPLISASSGCTAIRFQWYSF